MSIKHQVAINATEDVKAKLTFEREDKSQGIMINKYHTDISNTSKDSFALTVSVACNKVIYEDRKSVVDHLIGG